MNGNDLDTATTGDEALDEGALRPNRLDAFVGQSALKERLRVALLAARERREPMDHILFSGPPGLGKTTLAGILAHELDAQLHTTSAPAITRPRDLARILTMLNEGDILFIDEIHRLPPACEEILYPAMEDNFIDIVIGEGVTAQSVKLHLKPFTLAGATTRSGMLSSPLKARFGIELKLDFYNEAELCAIVERTTMVFGLDFEEEARRETAARARMTPRIANRLVRRIRDYATVERVGKITGDFVVACLEKLGVDEMGLLDLDRRILKLMIERYGGGPVGIKTLAALVDEEERTLEEDHEPFMLRLGLIEKTPQGRIATKAAADHLGLALTKASSSGSNANVDQSLLF